MSIKKILLVTLIAVAFVASVSVVSAGLFDDLFGGEDAQDNVVTIECCSFNTTNVTNEDIVVNETGSTDLSNWYHDKNSTGFNVHIVNTSDYSIKEIADEAGYSEYGVIEGFMIYVAQPNVGGSTGVRYIAMFQDKNLGRTVDVWSPDLNETLKMAKSFKWLNNTEEPKEDVDAEPAEVQTTEPAREYPEEYGGGTVDENGVIHGGQADGLSIDEAEAIEAKIKEDGGMIQIKFLEWGVYNPHNYYNLVLIEYFL